MTRDGQRKAQRQWRYQEVEAIDQILHILDGLLSWRVSRRVLFYVLLLRWERLGKTITTNDLEA